MVGGYGPAITKYIQSIIEAIDKFEFRNMEMGEDTIYHIVRNIVSGGSFTNKMDPTGNGRFDPSVDLDKLLGTTRSFFHWTKGVNASKFKKLSPDEQAEIRKEPMIVYRHVRLSAANAVKNMIQPIPMSCTWDINFAIGWMQSHACCVYEITFPSTDVFLPLSLPPPHPQGISKVPLNQPQYEVTVAPCILTYMGTRMHNGVTIYMYNGKTCADLEEVNRNFARVVASGCFL